MTGQPEELRVSSSEKEAAAGGPVQPAAETNVSSAAAAPPETDAAATPPNFLRQASEAAPEVSAEGASAEAPAASAETVHAPEVPFEPEALAATEDQAAPEVQPEPEAQTAPRIQASPVIVSAPTAPTPAPSSPPPSLPMEAPAVEAPALESPVTPAPPPAASSPAASAAPPPAAPPEPPMSAPALPGLPSTGASEREVDDLDPAEEAALAEFTGEAIVAAVSLREGDRRPGVVVRVSDEGAVIDVGGNAEGLLSSGLNPAETIAALKPGEQVDVVVVQPGEPGEHAQLELVREENAEAWNELEAAFREKRPVTAKVIERVKGGLTVDVGVPAFLPGSQVSLRVQQDLDALVGEELPVRVVKLSRRRGNVVVSRRELLEEELAEVKKETLSKISVGEVVTGTVKNVTSYGAFVDLGGVDGLIHVTDISYGRIKNPSDALTPGQQVSAKVVRFDPEKERVSLSLKEMEPDPWKSAEERFHEGGKVRGKVASVTDYGVFVELEPGVEGLIHITEMTWSKRLKHPSKMVKEGDELEAVVLKVQPGQRRISLSLRKTQNDPWDEAGARYALGAIVDGRVRNVTTYGAFVEVEEGVDGLVHVSDLSWDSRVPNPKDVLKKGQRIKTVVLSVDAANRRMSLGVKQLEADVWERFFATRLLGETLVGRVTRQAKFGAFVEVESGIEGLCHSSEMPRRGRKDGVQTGKAYAFEIIKMDEFEKRIGLRCVSLDVVELEQAAGAAN